MCKHDPNIHMAITQALEKKFYPAPRHFMIGVKTPSSRDVHPISITRVARVAIIPLGLLFLFRCLTPDESYWVAIAWTIATFALLLGFAFTIRGWVLEMGEEILCDCNEEEE